MPELVPTRMWLPPAFAALTSDLRKSPAVAEQFINSVMPLHALQKARLLQRRFLLVPDLLDYHWSWLKLNQVSV